MAPTSASPSVKLKADAKRAVDVWLKHERDVVAVCLFGSTARGDATKWSDIDLLVLTQGEPITPSRLLRRLPTDLRKRHFSLLVYSVDGFKEHYQEGALFIAHVLREGVPVHDPNGVLKDLLSKPFVPHVDVEEELETQLSRLAPYEEVSRFESNFLFCLAHIYAIGKGVVMLRLADQGIFEFDRDRAFDRFATMYPRERSHAEQVRSLRPFHSLVTDRRPERLPFSYRAAATDVERAIRAVKVLAKAS